MAYIGHNRLSIFGSFDKSLRQDVWTVNLNFGGDLRPEAASAAQNTAIEAAVVKWWSTGNPVRNYMSQGVYLDGFSWNAIGPNGRYVTPETPNTVYLTGIYPGTGATPKQGPDSCLVVSLYTPKKGKRYRGRIFIPCDFATLDATWNVTSTVVNTYRDATATLIQDLNTAFGPSPGGQGKAIVASSFGVNTPVSELRVGNMLDHQGRRRNRMDENYVSVAIP